MRRYLVTGSAGFIGSHLVGLLLEQEPDSQVLSLDALTYAGSLKNLPPDSDRHHFVHGDICDEGLVSRLLIDFAPDVIFNLAAESHVDRSLSDASAFVRTNVEGTANMLACAKWAWEGSFESHRYVQISTDEVYGSLPLEGTMRFTEKSPLHPNSPYSASKAAADLMTLAYVSSFAFPAIIVRGSNNYGPRQYLEKLVPMVISTALAHEKIPVYGSGKNVRDWLYVTDFCSALYRAACGGRVGEAYNIGASCELQNLELIELLLAELRRQTNDSQLGVELIRHVADRPGHDARYAMDASKARVGLGWDPKVPLSVGITNTVRSYLH